MHLEKPVPSPSPKSKIETLIKPGGWGKIKGEPMGLRSWSTSLTPHIPAPVQVEQGNKYWQWSPLPGTFET